MPKTIEELEKENAALRAENTALQFTKEKLDEDEKLIRERMSLSGGVLSYAQAREIVRQQREWDAHPANPLNAKKEESTDKVEATPGDTEQEADVAKPKKLKK